MQRLRRRRSRPAGPFLVMAGFSGYEAQSGRFSNPRRDSRVPVLCPFQVLQVLLQRRFVELRQEFGGGRGIVPANVVDQLTFVHDGHTFKRAVGNAKQAGSSCDRSSGPFSLEIDAMTQTNSPPTPAQGMQPIQAPAAHDPAADTDPLLHLHKMSTTAGVGNDDYVAVNVTAVVAVLFGLASLLAVLNTVLLVFPIVGVILGVIAFRQVSHSNGTQTGKGLAVLGLGLSGIITAVIFCVQGLQAVHRRADHRALTESVREIRPARRAGEIRRRLRPVRFRLQESRQQASIYGRSAQSSAPGRYSRQ